MILKLKQSFLLIILSILFYSCEKEYSLEGNVLGGTAVFSFTGSPGVCTNSIVSGSYVPGTPLGATNVITLTVDVSTAGTYTVSTATVNGISFTGAGTFNTTGPQVISLTGAGTPLAQGNFAFNPGPNSCSFSVTVSTGGGGSGGTAVYTLNGAPGACTTFSPGGTYVAGTPLGSGNFANVSVNVTTPGTYTITTNTLNGFSFSATGTFTAAGLQLVQLSGSGTPLVGGIFDFNAGANGCTFPITVTGSSTGSAVFTYDGAPASCTNAIPAGTYTAGTVLTASNTVTIDVNVSAIGTYSISTPSVNGFSFSGSGTFAATGPQTVLLTGLGTPTIGGVFSFTPSNNGCSFSITVINGTVATDFLRCTIDGVAHVFNDNLTFVQIDPTTVGIGGEEQTAVDPASFNITLGKSPQVNAGTYNRISATNTSTYCLIAYLEGVTANAWLTGLLPTSSNFTVIVTSVAGNRIDGTFSGTIYSDPILGTGPKTVTAGSFSVPF